jgi:NAD(P)-dependent dehydrogenase (short-subunit alcohol dehydrogenase family)
VADTQPLAGWRIVVAGSGPAPGVPDDIGQASVAAFAAAGAEVVFVQPRVDAAVDARVIIADPSRPAELTAACEQLTAEWDRVDVLVTHFMGVFGRGVDDTSLEQWDAALGVCLTSVFVMVKGLLPALVRSEHAAIVNVSSIDATFANPNILGYTVAKSGVNALTRSLAADLAGRGVRVNAVARAASTANGLSGRDAESVFGATPLARAGTPEEYAAAVRFLASPEASYLTGVVLPVDGGRTAVTPGVPPGYRPYGPKES